VAGAMVVFKRLGDGNLSWQGCLGTGDDPSAPPGCTGTTGLLGASGVAVSPDGHNVYAAGNGSNAVVAFNRVPGGGSGGGGGSTPTVSVTAGNQKIVLSTSVPSGCLATSAKLMATLNSTTIANSTGSKLKFVKAQFFIDRGVRHVHHHTIRRHGKTFKVTTVTYTANRTVKSLPANLSFPLTGLKHGTHSLHARVVFHKVHPSNQTVTKKLSQKFSVCV